MHGVSFLPPFHFQWNDPAIWLRAFPWLPKVRLCAWVIAFAIALLFALLICCCSYLKKARNCKALRNL